MDVYLVGVVSNTSNRFILIGRDNAASTDTAFENGASFTMILLSSTS